MMPKHIPQHVVNQWSRLFNFSLSGLWSPLYGFDVIKFDASLGTPDGVSTRDHLKATKGEDAVTLIETLLKL